MQKDREEQREKEKDREKGKDTEKEKDLHVQSSGSLFVALLPSSVAEPVSTQKLNPEGPHINKK